MDRRQRCVTLARRPVSVSTRPVIHREARSDTLTHPPPATARSLYLTKSSEMKRNPSIPGALGYQLFLSLGARRRSSRCVLATRGPRVSPFSLFLSFLYISYARKVVNRSETERCVCLCHSFDRNERCRRSFVTAWTKRVLLSRGCPSSQLGWMMTTSSFSRHKSRSLTTAHPVLALYLD